jgi:hypothetical protein
MDYVKLVKFFLDVWLKETTKTKNGEKKEKERYRAFFFGI